MWHNLGMAYEYETGGSPDPAPAPAEPTPAPESSPVAEISPAVQRFQSCRWRQKAEDGVPDHCAHRDVQPMTGNTGFDPEAWCPDCAHYQVRRTPRKPTPRPPSDQRYY
jgi:hypothetical protein